MKKPLLLLDIDGVLAPFLSHEAMDAIKSAENHDDEAEDILLPHKSVKISMFQTVHLRRDLPEIMRALMGHFELMWGTAWGGYQANEHMLRHLGLENPLQAIDYHEPVEGVTLHMDGIQFEGDTMPDFWKMPWIEKFAEESGRPFVFIDDEIGVQAEDWAEKRSADGIPTLMVKTDGTIGWADHHKDRLIDWAKENSDGC